MAATKNCPRCGTALKTTGDKFVCPSCRVSLVRRSKGDSSTSPIQETLPTPQPISVPVIDFTAPRPMKQSTLPMLRNGVLAGAALFLLLGTVLTGYAFARTFSTPVETVKPPEPVVDRPKPPPPPPSPPE